MLRGPEEICVWENRGVQGTSEEGGLQDDQDDPRTDPRLEAGLGSWRLGR